MLFLKIVKFWLKLALIIALIFFIGRCYFSKKPGGRSAYHPVGNINLIKQQQC